MFSILICVLALSLTSCDQRSSSSAPAVTSAPQCSATLPICLNQCCPEKPAQDMLVDHNIFVLANNPKTKFADWVAYKVDANNIGSTRTRTWKRDPQLPDDETLSPPDYKGAYAAHDYHRGHQAPLASFTSTNQWKKTNYLSNISPQKASLNSGPFLKGESAIRVLARKEGDVYVITGTLYEHSMPSLPHSHLSHEVPSGYWKIVVLSKGDQPNIATFVFDQGMPRSIQLCQSKTTLHALQQRLSFNPLPAVSSYSETLPADMGCP